MNRQIEILLLAIAFLFSISIGNQAQSLSKIQKWELPNYFRGFNVGLWCSENDCEKTQEDIDALKNIGANLAQINVYGAGFRHEEFPYDINLEGIDWITRLVNFCRNTELQYTIAVRTGPGRYDVSDNIISPIWGKENTTQVKMYGKMLMEIAKKFLPDTLFVGLNLTVEPNPYSEQYLSPADLRQTLLDNEVDLYNIYKTWIDSVRTITPELPLIIQSAQYSSPEYWEDPVLIRKQDDPNIIYDFHTYEPFDDFTHFETINGSTYPATAWNETMQDYVLWDSTFYADVVFAKVKSFQKTHNVPIFMGEFGLLLPQNNGDKYLRDIYDMAINNNWHFALWSWRADGRYGEVYFNYERFDETTPGLNYWNTVKSFFSDLTAVNANKSFDYPAGFKLFHNYPNPFNPSTVIRYEIPVGCQITIKIYDILGNEIEILLHEEQSAGYYEVNFYGSGLSSGVYYYQVKIMSLNHKIEHTDTKKMVLLK